MRIADLLQIGHDGALSGAELAVLNQEIQDSNLDEEQIKAAVRK